MRPVHPNTKTRQYLTHTHTRAKNGPIKPQRITANRIQKHKERIICKTKGDLPIMQHKFNIRKLINIIEQRGKKHVIISIYAGKPTHVYDITILKVEIERNFINFYL